MNKRIATHQAAPDSADCPLSRVTVYDVLRDAIFWAVFLGGLLGLVYFAGTFTGAI